MCSGEGEVLAHYPQDNMVESEVKSENEGFLLFEHDCPSHIQSRSRYP